MPKKFSKRNSLKITLDAFRSSVKNTPVPIDDNIYNNKYTVDNNVNVVSLVCKSVTGVRLDSTSVSVLKSFIDDYHDFNHDNNFYQIAPYISKETKKRSEAAYQTYKTAAGKMATNNINLRVHYIVSCGNPPKNYKKYKEIGDFKSQGDNDPHILMRKMTEYYRPNLKTRMTRMNKDSTTGRTTFLVDGKEVDEKDAPIDCQTIFFYKNGLLWYFTFHDQRWCQPMVFITEIEVLEKDHIFTDNIS